MPSRTPPNAAQAMSITIDYALHLESKSKHRFGISDKTSGMPTNESVSPSLSPANQYYLDCVNCGRTVFQDNTGSATDSQCN